MFVVFARLEKEISFGWAKKNQVALKVLKVDKSNQWRKGLLGFIYAHWTIVILNYLYKVWSWLVQIVSQNLSLGLWRSIISIQSLYTQERPSDQEENSQRSYPRAVRTVLCLSATLNFCSSALNNCAVLAAQLPNLPHCQVIFDSIVI